MKRLSNILGINKETFSTNFTLIFLIFVISTVTITPILYIEKYVMVLWTLFFILIFKQIKNTDIRLRKTLFLGTTFIFICTIYWAVGISQAPLAYCIVRPFVFFMPILALIIIDLCGNENQIKFLFHLLSLAIAINITDSIWITHSLGFEDLVYQNLAETLEEEGDGRQNLGGSLYVSMIVFYANVTFFAFLNASNKQDKFLFLLYFCVSTYFILICSLKASAILFLLISLLLQFIANQGRRNFGLIVTLTSIFIALLVFFHDQLIHFLIDIIGSDRITARLEVFLTGASASDNASFAGREDLWLTSLHTWLNNPINFILGIGDRNWKDYAFTAASGIGDHSDFLDVLARYGIIGGAILYSSIILLYRYLQERYASYFKWEIISFFVLIVLMGLFKKIVSGEPAIVIFILFPLCIKYFYNQKLDNTI